MYKINKTYICVKEAAHLLRVTDRTLYRNLASGKIQGIRVGRSWRIELVTGNPKSARSD